MRRSEEVLDERSKRILRDLVAHYCITGEPVGSRTLSKKGRMNLSPATIRNVLADLEEMGYIMQPHTSAGRVPTEKGYRFYVNNLLRSHELNEIQRQLIDERFKRTSGSLEELLLLTTNLLSSLSHNIALAVAPNLEKLFLENIQFVPVHNHRILAIVVARGGMVYNKIIELDEAYSPEELGRIANYLKTEYSQLTLPAIRKRIIDLMKQEQTQYDQMLRRAALLGQKALDIEAVNGGELYVDGASQIANYPDFSLLKTRGLLEALEEKSRIVRVLTQCIEGEGINILIGSENRQPQLRDFSLISSPYRYKDQPIGTVGILGPLRMEYDRVIPLVDHIAKVVSKILTQEN